MRITEQGEVLKGLIFDDLDSLAASCLIFGRLRYRIQLGHLVLKSNVALHGVSQ